MSLPYKASLLMFVNVQFNNMCISNIDCDNCSCSCEIVEDIVLPIDFGRIINSSPIIKLCRNTNKCQNCKFYNADKESENFCQFSVFLEKYIKMKLNN